MLIRIRLNSGACDYVKPHVLDRLIEDNLLISFQRRSGVVVLGIHPIRENNRGGSSASLERRSQP